MVWLIISTMIISALAIVILPLLQTVKSQDEFRTQQNISIAQDQLRKLKEEKQQGMMTDADYELAMADLEQSLHSDLANQSNGASYDSGSAYKISGILLLIVPIIIVSLYYYLGSPKLVGAVMPKSNNSAISIGMEQAKQEKVADVKSMFNLLKQRLESNPDDGQGWMMMGLTYMHFEQFDEAVDAYQKAVNLLPNNENAIDGLDRAKVAQSGKSVSTTQLKTIDKKMVAPNGQTVDVGAMVMRLKAKLEKNPNNPQGWLMLGRSYTHLGLNNDAVYAYQQALKLMPNNTQVINLLDVAKNTVNNKGLKN